MDSSTISNILTFLGVVITVIIGNSKTIWRIEQLEKKQDKYNHVIERQFITEKKQEILGEQIKVANHRIADLEESIK